MRKTLAYMPLDMARGLFKGVKRLLQYAMDIHRERKCASVYDTIVQEYPLSVASEILSRLVVMCEDDGFDGLVDLLLDIYSYPDRDTFSRVKSYTERIIQCMPLAVLERNLDRLWNIDIYPDNSHMNINFPDPFQYINIRIVHDGKDGSYKLNKQQKVLYRGLIAKAADRNYKLPALSRLSYLYQIYDIGQDLKDEYKALLWSKENLGEYGLPNLGNTLPVAFKSKVLVITGGTGSFGSTVLKHSLSSDLSEIRIISRDEKKQDMMRHILQDRYPSYACKVAFYIGDMRNIDSVRDVMYGANYVFHAAVLKEVPSCGFFPMEAVKTNIISTDNVITAVVEDRVERVVFLSTDKAAYPINSMGMTKAMAEKVVAARVQTVLACCDVS